MSNPKDESYKSEFAERLLVRKWMHEGDRHEREARTRRKIAEFFRKELTEDDLAEANQLRLREGLKPFDSIEEIVLVETQSLEMRYRRVYH